MSRLEERILFRTLFSMAVFFGLSLVLLGYALSGRKFLGPAAFKTVNMLMFICITSEILFCILNLSLSESTDPQELVTITVVINVSDIFVTVCLEFAYVLRLRACLVNPSALKASTWLMVYPALYPLADIAAIYAQFHPEFRYTSDRIWDGMNIALVLQEFIVHSVFFHEIFRIYSYRKVMTFQVYFLLAMLIVYMAGFLVSLVLHTVYQDDIYFELLVFFTCLNIALFHPIMMAVLGMKPQVNTNTEFFPAIAAVERRNTLEVEMPELLEANT
ncbi:hypothetical protein EDD86DRAFT_199317 [Gorgonomyces haynaldii]|nr:hypothetical protein EDD86DRAFT_199317 [Gorgonomyces haynaldii]